MKPLRVDYFCIIPTLWLKKPVITGYFASTIVVSDTGLGVEPENAEKIFTPGITAKPKGVGMGLVIVTELVNAYNGKAGLRYPGNLHGATFVFDVPMKRGESQ